MGEGGGDRGGLLVDLRPNRKSEEEMELVSGSGRRYLHGLGGLGDHEGQKLDYFVALVRN